MVTPDIGVSAGEFGPAVKFNPLPLTSRYLWPLMAPGLGVSVSEAVLLLGMVSVTPPGEAGPAVILGGLGEKVSRTP